MNTPDNPRLDPDWPETHEKQERDPIEAFKHMQEMEEAERLRNEIEDTGKDAQYPGDLIEDCAAVTGSQALHDVGRIFADVFGDADREARCNGFYSRQARGE